VWRNRNGYATPALLKLLSDRPTNRRRPERKP
jgi:hypothetical protein